MSYLKERNVWRRNVKKEKSKGLPVPLGKKLSKEKQVVFDKAIKAYEIDPQFKKEQEKTVLKNQIRRSKLKINQNPHPKSYYKDCYVNGKEYKDKHKN
jgi:hypothetical protein